MNTFINHTHKQFIEEGNLPFSGVKVLEEKFPLPFEAKRVRLTCMDFWIWKYAQAIQYFPLSFFDVLVVLSSPCHCYYIICLHNFYNNSSDRIRSLLCLVYLRGLSEKHTERRQKQQQRKIVQLTSDVIFSLNSTAQSIKEIPEATVLTAKNNVCIHPAEPAINKPSWRTVFSYQFKYILFSLFLPQSQRGRIKSKVMKSIGVCWAITYALVI